MKISTIIPAFNCEAYLRRAVESLLATNDPDQEIVIVDDGSRDATLEIAHALQNEHPRIISVKTHPGGGNCGVSTTRNRGIEHSTGELIALLDADDYIYPHRFESARAILSENPDVDGVYQLSVLEFANDQARRAWWDDKLTFGFTTAIPPERLIFELLRGHCWATSAIVFRRSLLNRAGVFEPNLRLSEDCHLWFRMAIAGKLVAGDLSRPVSVYWRHGESAHQPSPELRLPMIHAMTSFWRWLKLNAPLDPRCHEISRSISEYILHGISSSRTTGRRQLAWKIAMASAWRFSPVMAYRRWYGHVARMALGH